MRDVFIYLPKSIEHHIRIIILNNTNRKSNRIFFLLLFMILFNINPKENIWIQRVWSLEVLKSTSLPSGYYMLWTWSFFFLLTCILLLPLTKYNVLFFLVVLLCQNCLIESNTKYVITFVHGRNVVIFWISYTKYTFFM